MNTEIFVGEKARADRAVRDSEARFKRLLASVTDYVYTVSIDHGRVVSTEHGPGCEAVTGYSPEEFNADDQLWYRMIFESDREAVLNQARLILKGVAPPPIEHRIIHKNGEIRWIRNTPVPRLRADGQLGGYDGLVSDISERKRAEHLLAVQYSATRILAHASTLDDALPQALEAICAIFGSFLWDFAAFWRVEGKSSGLRCVATWRSQSLRAAECEAVSQKVVYGLGQGIAGEVWTTGEYVCETNLRRLGAERERACAAAGLVGVCAFPIRLKGEVAGVIELFSRGSQQPEADIMTMLTAVGTQIGQFIQRKAGEEALAAERNLLRTLVDTLPVYIYVKDSESRFVMTNAAHMKVLGASALADVLGKSDSDFFPRELVSHYLQDEQLVLAGEQVLNREEPALDHEGQVHWLTTTKVPLKDTNGSVSGLVGISLDVTDKKKAELAMRESQERLALVMQGSYDGIWDWDLTTNKVYFSPRWKNVLGYQEQELPDVFSTWEQLLHPDDQARARATVNDYLTKAIPNFELEHRLRHKDGTYRWMLARGVALRDEQGKPTRMAGCHVDLTERKEAEQQLHRAYLELAQNEDALRKTLQDLRASNEELKSAQLQLIQAAKLESVGTLAAGIAHEVKNPLQTMIMGLDFLDRNLQPRDNNALTVLADMRDAVSRANSIVKELLTFSAANHSVQQSEDLNGIIERSLWLIHGELMGSQIKVVRQLDQELPKVEIDAVKIEQVFINLFINAIQAMTPGGTLTVSTTSMRLEEGARLLVPAAALSCFRTGDELVLARVEDTGGGISEEHLTKIFDPFFTTKPVGVGTGLGLSVVKKIIDLHGGVIDIRNGAHRGVAATVILKTSKE